MEKFETFTYELDGNLYINLTSKCTNDCTFCVRNEHSTYFGHKLWLDRKSVVMALARAFRRGGFGAHPKRHIPL